MTIVVSSTDPTNSTSRVDPTGSRCRYEAATGETIDNPTIPKRTGPMTTSRAGSDSSSRPALGCTDAASANANTNGESPIVRETPLSCVRL